MSYETLVTLNQNCLLELIWQIESKLDRRETTLNPVTRNSNILGCSQMRGLGGGHQQAYPQGNVDSKGENCISIPWHQKFP